MVIPGMGTRMREEIQLSKKSLTGLAERVIDLTRSEEKREEDIWLAERFGRYLAENGLKNRGEGDLRLYKTMTGEEAPAPSAVLKIRFWRTAKHYPKNREVCEAFGRALQLDPDEERYLMTAWFDRADRCFGPEDVEDPLYRERHALLVRLQQEFLDKQRPEELLAMCAPGTLPWQNLRYIYCSHAVRYLGSRTRKGNGEMLTHLDTRSYEFQFTREMKLTCEVSRSTMIRHLLVLGMPFVTRKFLNEWLQTLGYLPLTETHRQPGGAATDLFVLGLLEEYEKECTGRDPLWCMEWFRQAAGILDEALRAGGCADVNPFRFKHITGGQDVRDRI